jgi:RNA polymerase sigma factor (sigma-70 family)
MSFEELIEQISSKLKGIAYKIHRTVPSFCAEDLYQEAILNLFADYKSGKLADKTESYVLQGCYFYLQNYVRTYREKTSLISVNMPLDADGAKLQDILWSPQTVADEVPDLDTLMENIFQNELTRKEKEIVFFYLQGWTTREIAQRLGISHVSVGNMEGKIREKCKSLKNSV